MQKANCMTMISPLKLRSSTTEICIQPSLLDHDEPQQVYCDFYRPAESVIIVKDVSVEGLNLCSLTKPTLVLWANPYIQCQECLRHIVLRFASLFCLVLRCLVAFTEP